MERENMPQLDRKDSELKKASANHARDLQSVARILANALSIDREYTECQEFFGAITLDSHAPLGQRIVTMLDVALRGIGDHWNDVILPGFDFCVVENTLGKDRTSVQCLTSVPVHAQELVGA